MYIKKIVLNNFRNYEKQEIKLNKNINVFYGNNAQGKTNILEAIFICAIGKSFRTVKDKELIKFEREKAEVLIQYDKIDRQSKIKIEIDDKKSIYVNDINIKKLSELLGNLNIVLFSPEDIEIFKNGPNMRRKYLNIMIGQLRKNYIFILNQYLKILDQRNNYLKQIKFENKKEDLLDPWDESLAQYAEKIYLYRKEFVNKIILKIDEIHSKITNKKEKIKIEYISDFNTKQKFIEQLKLQRQQDIKKGFTTKGIHRDDLIVYINDKQLNIYGSQGQHRSVILSLKLTELEIIKEEIGENPVLLLDDFMSELDNKRRINFLNNIKDIQVLITCTEKIELKEKQINKYEIKNGKVYI